MRIIYGRIADKVSVLSNSLKKSQSDKFKQAARALECDEDEARWNEKLKKLARHKPPPEKWE